MRLQIRLVCQFVNVLDVMVLPPYMPSAAEKADALLYASNVRALYASETGWPLVEQSQREFIALCKVRIDFRKGRFKLVHHTKAQSAVCIGDGLAAGGAVAARAHCAVQGAARWK